MGLVVIVVAGLLAGHQHELPQSHILRMVQAMQMCAADVPAMQNPAEIAAARLVAGGRLWAAGQASWVSEITGRAGGLMMIKPLRDKPADGDVVLYAPNGNPPANFGSAYVISFGAPVSGAAAWFNSYAEEAGISPSLAGAIPAWCFTGELIAALTRSGKMPVVYESIGAYGGNARIAQYKNGEIAWHDQCPPPVPHGRMSAQYLEKVCHMLRSVDRNQRANLKRAGDWARRARKTQGTLHMYSMGHLFPDEVGKTDIAKVFKSAVWNAGFRNSPPPDDVYAPGDFVVHIGYQHPPALMLERATAAGARAAYVSVLADRDYKDNPDVIYIDPMWDWPDACVEIEGYDVPLLAASGIVNGAIAWEIYRLSTN